MAAHRSPWLAQVPSRRRVKLSRDTACDTVVIGAGISGVATAYYLLKDTRRSVVLLDAGRLAHGATGHNAGQIASYFELPFSEIAHRHGLERAAHAQLGVLSAWDMLDRIADHADLAHRPLSFAGYAGCTSVPQLLTHLRSHALRASQNVSSEFTYVLDDPAVLREIPQEYEHLYSAISLQELQDRLETHSRDYIAALTSRKGCMNSALFCHDLVEFLEDDERFSLFEHSPVSHVTLAGEWAVVSAAGRIVRAREVVFCTNGYALPALTHGTHPRITRIVGHMSAYTQRGAHPPFAVSYFGDSSSHEDPYFYVTRRPHGPRSSLVCVGGPERIIGQDGYDASVRYVPSGAERSLAFAQRTYAHAPSRFTHEWEGLMGYTPTGLRLVGRHPRVAPLLYNLGCNGVGILAGIYGAKRVSLILQGKRLEKSAFDVEHAFEREGMEIAR